MTTTKAKIDRAIEILEAKGHKWTMELADAVHERARSCDGKDSPAAIARFVSRQIKATA